MNGINPFDNLRFKHGPGQAEEVNSPSKVDEQKTQNQPDKTQGIEALPKSNEDDFVDMSDMVDDTGDFNTSDFNFEGEDKTGEVDSSKAKDDNSQNQGSQNEDDIQKQAEELVSELLEKQNQ